MKMLSNIFAPGMTKLDELRKPIMGTTALLAILVILLIVAGIIFLKEI